MKIFEEKNKYPILEFDSDKSAIIRPHNLIKKN